MIPDDVRAHLDAHRDHQIELLAELVRYASIANVKDQPDSCQCAAGWLADLLNGMGLKTELLPGEEDALHDRPYVFAEARAGDDRPTVLLYGHYDVQPAEPLEQWQSPPFELTVRDGCAYGRGASDDKGQVIAQIMAVEAWRHSSTGLPINVKLLFEGEEEIGSPHADAFIRRHADRLAADAVLIGDGCFFAADCPSITYALRGLVYFELVLTGPDHDVHSGQYGGLVMNPANALAKMIAALHDDEGRVTLEGFYDDVAPADEKEREDWAKLPLDEAEHAAAIGLSELGGGETGYSALQRCWERPTLDCNGIYGGFMAEGLKTIIPARAGAKISCRLVPDQDPQKIVAAMRAFVDRHTPPGIRAELTVHGASAPMLTATDSPAMHAAKAAMEEVFAKRPVLVRMGASVPIAEALQRLMKVAPIIMGCGLPGDLVHAPNEHASLEQLHAGARLTAALIANLAEALAR